LGCLLVEDTNAYDVKNISETFLIQTTRDATQAIINLLWRQPTKFSEDGTSILAALPEQTTVFPREKPFPKAKPPTKWEKFARQKGIQKSKKSRKVWDDESKDYIPAWGYQGQNNKEDWLMEVPQNADPLEDMYEKKKEVKKANIAKNKKQQERNIESNAKLDQRHHWVTLIKN
jgi:regulator of ribosome biosynthesis